MGAVGYTSTVSQRDYYLAERARGEAEIDTMPEAERQEIRDIYAAKGFTGALLEDVVDAITANRDRWLGTMMDEELHLQPVRSADVFRSAVAITIATLIGHLSRCFRSCGWPGRRRGLKMLVIGLGAAGVGFLIGNLFHGA